MIRLHVPHRLNCLLWAWYRYRIRPILLIRRRGRKNWRARAGYITKRPGHHGFFAHRLWSRDLTVFWGYTTPSGWRWRSGGTETLLAFYYKGQVTQELPGHSPEHHSLPHHHEIGVVPRRPVLHLHRRDRHRLRPRD